MSIPPWLFDDLADHFTGDELLAREWTARPPRAGNTTNGYKSKPTSSARRYG